MSRIDSIIDTAVSYLGITEYSASHKRVIDIYNKCRYADAYKMTYDDPWCAAFVVACFGENCYHDLIPCVASCDQMISYFKQWGNWHGRNEAIVPGDIIFYDWDKNGSSDHVGIVVKNNIGNLNIIEGNKSDSVGYRSIRVGDPTIIGFGRPNYDSGVNSTIIPINQYSRYYDRFSYSDRKVIFSLPLLQQGSTGVYVRVLQVFLKFRNGFDLEVDGEFGDQTKDAVLNWQLIKNLETDGVVGRETWSSLLL